VVLQPHQSETKTDGLGEACVETSFRLLIVACLGLIVGLAAAGAAWQAIASAREARTMPEPGAAVDIGRRRIQIYCTGQGNQVVVLEAGLGGLLNSWKHVQASIAGFSRVCAYDRAGYGASDAGPMPRTSTAIADDLHEALQRAGERAPFVLVGHSFGGYNVRVFNGRYPDEVAGVVLVDAPQEDQWDLLPPRWKETSDALLHRYREQARRAPLYIGLGIARLQLHWQGANAGTYLILTTKYLRARASEMESMPLSAEEARTADHVADKPLIVVTAQRSLDPESQVIWERDVQPRLARLSARGEQVLVDSTHDVPGEHPETIVEAVRRLARP
jgi:pimeloyl-ACP methyl ester carboxylesterase